MGATTRPGATARPTSLRARLLHVVVLTIVLVLAGGTSWAFWTSLGTGSGTAATGTLAAPTSVGGTATASSVALSWVAPTTGASPAGYVVVRTSTVSGSSSPACGSSATTAVAGTSCTDISVPDGSYRYTVTAVRGSWTAVSAPSAVVTVQSGAATTTSLSTSANPVLVGDTVTLTATVTAAAGTPTGTVAFKDGTTTIACTGGSQTLTSGTATCRTSWATSGPRTLTAAYAGAATFAASTSPALTQTVNPKTQTVAFTSTAPTSATFGGTYAVSATATSGLPVTFGSLTTAVCTVSGATVSFAGAGTCTVSANQAGNAMWAAATQVTQTFTVAKAAQTITFTTPVPVSPSGGMTYTVGAVASSGLPVTFATTSQVCTVSGTTVTFLGAGPCVVTANQAGNANVLPAPQVSQGITVTGAPAPPTSVVVATNTPSAGWIRATWTVITDPAYTYECQVSNGSSPFNENKWRACTSPFEYDAKNGTSTVWVRSRYNNLYSTYTQLTFSQ